MFISYVLMEAIRRGRTAYYTTLPGLDYDLKRGFSHDELKERLDLMLTSDFLALDEVGKEYLKGEGGGWIKTQMERILKQRFDDSMPVLLATNMDFDGLSKSYGPTMTSIFNGKYQQVAMMPGDFRSNLHTRMEIDMGYKK
jgi:DNA replication protein DnaC